MKQVLTVLLMIGFGVGSYCLGKKQTIVVVDIQKIIYQTAESLARKNLNPEQTQIQTAKFKTDLQKNLQEFALLRKTFIVPSHLLFGKTEDLTEDFIQFYNEGASS